MNWLIFLTFMAPAFGDVVFNESSIHIRLFTRENPTIPQIITDGNFGAIDTSRQAKFIIFGWTETADDPWIPFITKTYLATDSYNVFVLDWTRYAQTEYVYSATYAVPRVGRYLGNFLYQLITFGYSRNKIHLIGFSLGAQIAGVAGHQTAILNGGSKISRITSLEAAKPLFEQPILVPRNDRISDDDADFVDAIHTNALVFGFTRPYGHFDSYPNGGYYQFPCPLFVPNPSYSLSFSLREFIFCSHARSISYWIESITSNGFVAQKCPSYRQYLQGSCRAHPTAIMGQNASFSTRGVYYLTTNFFPPYARN